MLSLSLLQSFKRHRLAIFKSINKKCKNDNTRYDVRYKEDTNKAWSSTKLIENTILYITRFLQ